MKLTLKLTGIKPMLMHNGRLANPLDPHTRAVKALAGKRKKTDDDLHALARAEARGGCWETDDGLLGMPSAAVWRSLYDAAKGFKLGQDVKRALTFDDETNLLLVAGKKVKADKWVDDGNIDYRNVKVGMSKVMRARPRIPEGWQTTHTFELLEDQLDLATMMPVFERAGRLIGVGDWRPTYGRYELEVV